MSKRKLIRELGELLIKISEKDVYKELTKEVKQEEPIEVPEVAKEGTLEEVKEQDNKPIDSPVELEEVKPTDPATVEVMQTPVTMDQQKQTIERLENELQQIRQEKNLATFNFQPVKL